MSLQMTVTLGNVIQVASTVAAVIMAYYALRERLIRIETQLGPLWDQYTERRQHERREGWKREREERGGYEPG